MEVLLTMSAYSCTWTGHHFYQWYDSMTWIIIELVRAVICMTLIKTSIQSFMHWWCSICVSADWSEDDEGRWKLWLICLQAAPHAIIGEWHGSTWWRSRISGSVALSQTAKLEHALCARLHSNFRWYSPWINKKMVPCNLSVFVFCTNVKITGISSELTKISLKEVKASFGPHVRND